MTYTPKKRFYATFEALPHKWPVFCVGMVNNNFVVCLWLIQLEISRGY